MVINITVMQLSNYNSVGGYSTDKPENSVLHFYMLTDINIAAT
jgi:hypothetical protein